MVDIQAIANKESSDLDEQGPLFVQSKVRLFAKLTRSRLRLPLFWFQGGVGRDREKASRSVMNQSRS